MKTAFFVMCILCASAGLGQGIGASLNAQPQVYAFTSHPEHASQQPMAQIQNLNGGDIYVYARGERPLWEFAAPSHEVSLGDSARMLKQERLAAKKAVRYWQNW